MSIRYKHQVVERLYDHLLGMVQVLLNYGATCCNKLQRCGQFFVLYHDCNNYYCAYLKKIVL